MPSDAVENLYDLQKISENYISFGTAMTNEGNFLTISIFSMAQKDNIRFLLPIKEAAELLLNSGLAIQKR